MPPGYGWRRFWKIYPPLALSVLVFAPMYFLGSHDTAFVGVAVQWLVGLPLVMPVSGEFNPVMWSLIVEMHFYIVLPLLFLCLKRVPAKVCLWIVPLLFLVVPTGWGWLNAANGIYSTIHPEINVHFPSMLNAFALGILMAGLANMGMIKKGWAKLGDVGFILLALSLLTMSWLRLHPTLDENVWSEIPAWMVKIAAAFLLCYIADPQHPRARLLSQPWLRWCGIISYEWYLFHQPITLWARAWFGPAQGSLLKYGLIVGGSFVTSLILTAVIYRYFSLPILKYGRTKHTADKVPPPNVEAVRELPKF